MKIYVTARTYHSYGGHSTLSLIGDFLLRNAAEFGPAIQEIEIILHFLHSGPPKAVRKELFDRYHSHIATLPKITYRKAGGKIEVSFASELIDDRAWFSPRLSLPLLVRGVDEVIRALSLIRKRVKASDAFDFDQFFAHCEAARQGIPDSEDTLLELAAELKATDQARRAAMSLWEKLSIDWEDFHPRSREILDDPFFWDCGDDFSPNGNDTGADLLEAYRDWLKTQGDGQPIRFLERLSKQWGFGDIGEMGDDFRDEATIGLAFADIKLRGVCDEQLRLLALKSLASQRFEAETSTAWAYRDERLSALKKLEQKLQRTDAGK